MELDQVEAFVAIVRRGGFTRAAATLHLSQPAVSRRLDLLERELGRPLFDRTRGGAQLTEAGRAFLPHAETLLASMRDGVEAVRALERSDRGTVTVALVGTLANTLLTARLQRFRDAHRQVRLELRTALSREVSALVRRGDAALGLRYFPDPDPDIVSLPLYREALLHRVRPHPSPGPRAYDHRTHARRASRGSRFRSARAHRASRTRRCSPSAWRPSAWAAPRSCRSTASPLRSAWSRPASAWAWCRRAASRRSCASARCASCASPRCAWRCPWSSSTGGARTSAAPPARCSR